jgi:hypothetical protein
VEVSPRRSPKKKEDVSKAKEAKKESEEKPEVHENGVEGEGDGDNVMEVKYFQICMQ